MKNFVVRKVAVLGAGVMGAQIAAHCVNAKVPVVLFDLPDAKGPNKNGIVLRAIENLKKLNPAPLGNKDDAVHIQPANYEENLDLLRGCDVIIEAIAERMDWKHDLYRKVAPFVSDNAIFASNTSGLPIAKLAEAMDDALKARFCGVHFFNPPRYMHLVELIPTPATRPEILDDLETFLTSTLGKGVVRAKDTPNFIANRVGIFGMLATIKEAEKYGLSFDVVDDLTGTRLGRAKSATFRTADVVGLDTMAHVIKTMQDTLPASIDPFAEHFATPPVLKTLVDKGALGQKSGAGFYRKEGKAIHVLDPKTGAYVESGAKADDLVGRIMKKKDPAERLKLLRESDHPQAKFLWAIFRDAFHYIAVHLESIADTARDVDFALRWGFGWSTGPFETWQAAGWKQVADWVKADIEAGEALSKAPLPKWVFEGPVVDANGVHTPEGSWSPSKKKFVPRSILPVYSKQIFRAPLLGEGTATGATGGATVFEDDSVRVWTLESSQGSGRWLRSLDLVDQDESPRHRSRGNCGTNESGRSRGVAVSGPRHLVTRRSVLSGRRLAGDDARVHVRGCCSDRRRREKDAGRVDAHQVCTGARCHGRQRHGARRRLRVNRAQLENGRIARKLHRPGRSRRRIDSRRRRFEGRRTTRRAGGAGGRHDRRVSIHQELVSKRRNGERFEVSARSSTDGLSACHRHDRVQQPRIVVDGDQCCIEHARCRLSAAASAQGVSGRRPNWRCDHQGAAGQHARRRLHQPARLLPGVGHCERDVRWRRRSNCAGRRTVAARSRAQIFYGARQSSKVAGTHDGNDVTGKPVRNYVPTNLPETSFMK